MHSSQNDKIHAETTKRVERRSWEPMTIRFQGNVRDVVLMGGGKLSAATGDPGEPRKVPSTG